MKLPRLNTLLLCLLVAGMPPVLAQGRDRAGHDDGRTIVVAQGGISVDQAIAMVEQRFKARVVRADTKREGDRVVYVLRLLNDEGRVWTVRVDAQSGAIR